MVQQVYRMRTEYSSYVFKSAFCSFKITYKVQEAEADEMKTIASKVLEKCF